MSGISLASGARVISPADAAGVSFSSSAPPGSLRARITQTLSLAQLQLVAFGIVLVFSGVVPLWDVLFPPLIALYSFILSRTVFQHRSYGQAPRVLEADKLSRLYSMVGSILGLFLPGAYILGGFTRGEVKAVKAAAPNLYLLICQTLTESLMHTLNLGSLPVRALVPLLYNARRLVTNWSWVKMVFQDVSFPFYTTSAVGGGTTMYGGLSTSASVWMWFERTLALANMIFWTANVLCFLIPVFLPRAFVKHYELERPTTDFSLDTKSEKFVDSKKGA